MKLSPAVDQLLGSLSLEEKVGQIFIFTFVNLKQALLDLRFHPGGFVRIYSDALTVARQNARLQAESRLPLILSADFERGIGSTITGAIDVATMMCLGAAGDEEITYGASRVIAEEALALGINMNYVPVLDVNINEANPIINTRSFGADPALVARMGRAFIRGHRDAGVITCGKHFPGHGDTAVDSHTSLGSIPADRARMEAVELVPFRAAIEAGVDCIMSAHLLIPAYEPENLPATLSRRIMHGLLREELGFEGVAVSDALDMGAIARNFSPAEAIVRAINAGVDQLIMPSDNRRAVGILLEAVRSGQVSEARLDEAVARLLTLKEKRGLLAPAEEQQAQGKECVRYAIQVSDLTGLASRLDTPEHQKVALEAALAGTTLVRNEGAHLPLDPRKRVAVITFSNSEDSRSYYLEPKTFGAHLSEFLPDLENVNCAMLDERAVHEFQVVKRALEAAQWADVIVVGTYVKVVINRGTVGLEDRYVEFFRRLSATGKPVVLVSFGSPYLIKQFPESAAYVCCYGATEANQRAAALLLAGRAEFRGKLPVTVTLSPENPGAAAG